MFDSVDKAFDDSGGHYDDDGCCLFDSNDSCLKDLTHSTVVCFVCLKMNYVTKWLWLLHSSDDQLNVVDLSDDSMDDHSWQQIHWQQLLDHWTLKCLVFRFVVTQVAVVAATVASVVEWLLREEPIVLIPCKIHSLWRLLSVSSASFDMKGRTWLRIQEWLLGIQCNELQKAYKDPSLEMKMKQLSKLPMKMIWDPWVWQKLQCRQKEAIERQ